MSEPKPSEMIETLLMLMRDDEDGTLLTTDDWGNPRNICEICRYTQDTCEVCPFNGNPKRIERLRALLPTIKTLELIDADTI